jgi:hypothetical protein
LSTARINQNRGKNKDRGCSLRLPSLNNAAAVCKCNTLAVNSHWDAPGGCNPRTLLNRLGPTCYGNIGPKPFISAHTKLSTDRVAADSGRKPIGPLTRGTAMGWWYLTTSILRRRFHYRHIVHNKVILCCIHNAGNGTYPSERPTRIQGTTSSVNFGTGKASPTWSHRNPGCRY